MMDFLTNREKLETRLFEMFQEIRLDLGLKKLLINLLEELKSVDEDPYHHSIGVTNLGFNICEYTVSHPYEFEDYTRLKSLGMIFDPTIVFLSHLLHDVGKKDVPKELLLKTKTSEFNHDDWVKMQEHVINSYNIIKKRLPLLPPIIKSIVIRHHTYQPEPYPLILPVEEQGFSDNQLSVINFYSERLAIADSYDSCRTRKNSMFLQRLTSEKSHDIMLGRYKKNKQLINKLYSVGIF